MTKLQLSLLRLCQINNRQTCAYEMLQHTILSSRRICILILTLQLVCFFPNLRCLVTSTTCNHNSTNLTTFSESFGKEVYGGMNHFLKRFNTTSNDKANRTLNLGKARLGRGEVIPLNYRQQCLQAYSAMLHILSM